MPTLELLNRLAHKLRVCTSVICILITVAKIFPCLWILHGWQTSLVPLLRCATGGISLRKCFDDLAYLFLSVLMVVSAKRSFWTHGHNWHRAHLGGVLNVAAAVGWLVYCDRELQALSAILNMALRKKRF